MGSLLSRLSERLDLEFARDSALFGLAEFLAKGIPYLLLPLFSYLLTP